MWSRPKKLINPVSRRLDWTEWHSQSIYSRGDISTTLHKPKHLFYNTQYGSSITTIVSLHIHLTTFDLCFGLITFKGQQLLVRHSSHTITRKIWQLLERLHMLYCLLCRIRLDKQVSVTLEVLANSICISVLFHQFLVLVIIQCVGELPPITQIQFS